MRDYGRGEGGEKGDRHLLCEAPEGPFRQKVSVPFPSPFSLHRRAALVVAQKVPVLLSRPGTGQTILDAVRNVNKSRSEVHEVHASNSLCGHRRCCGDGPDQPIAVQSSRHARRAGRSPGVRWRLWRIRLWFTRHGGRIGKCRGWPASSMARELQPLQRPLRP